MRKRPSQTADLGVILFLAKKIWVCSCDLYWVWNEADARRHAKESGHQIKEVEWSDEEFERLKKASVFRLRLLFGWGFWA